MLKINKKICGVIPAVCLTLFLAGCDSPGEKEPEAEIEQARYLTLKQEKLSLTSARQGVSARTGGSQATGRWYYY